MFAATFSGFQSRTEARLDSVEQMTGEIRHDVKDLLKTMGSVSGKLDDKPGTYKTATIAAVVAGAVVAAAYGADRLFFHSDERPATVAPGDEVKASSKGRT